MDNLQRFANAYTEMIVTTKNVSLLRYFRNLNREHRWENAEELQLNWHPIQVVNCTYDIPTWIISGIIVDIVLFRCRCCLQKCDASKRPSYKKLHNKDSGKILARGASYTNTEVQLLRSSGLI